MRQKAIAAAELKKMDPESKEKGLYDLQKASRINGRNIKIVSDVRNTANNTGKMTSTAFFSKLSDQQKMKDERLKRKSEKKKLENAEKVSKFKL